MSVLFLSLCYRALQVQRSGVCAAKKKSNKQNNKTDRPKKKERKNKREKNEISSVKVAQ